MSNEIDMKGVAQGAILGGVGAGVVCVGLYFVGLAIGATFVPRDPAMIGGMAVMPPYPPFISCVMAAIAAIGLMALLKKVAGAKAWPIFLGVAAVVFLIQVYMPFRAFADMKTVLILEVMHFVPALGIIGGIRRFGLKGAAATALPA